MYIMETDHLLLQDLPNLAPDKDTVAGFYFPYMDPNPPDMAKVVSRFYKEGPPSDLYATGPSPTILHVDVLKRIVQLWCDSPPPPFVFFGDDVFAPGFRTACAFADCSAHGLRRPLDAKLFIVQASRFGSVHVGAARCDGAVAPNDSKPMATPASKA